MGDYNLPPRRRHPPAPALLPSQQRTSGPSPVPAGILSHDVAVARSIAATYACVALWIVLSGLVICLNKWILVQGGFPYPLALTLWHQLLSSALAFGVVRAGYVDAPSLPQGTYLRAILPIGALNAGTLWLGNSGYLYLSVSFIQMLKAFAPAIVFLVGCALGVDRFSWRMLTICMLCFVGVAITSTGEINFSWVGFLYQNGSTVTESVRVVLVQVLLQSRGLQLNPITTLPQGRCTHQTGYLCGLIAESSLGALHMLPCGACRPPRYYVAPACVASLLPPFLALEAGKMLQDPHARLRLDLWIASGLAAFALNVSIFLLIGRTSALSARIAGLVKDLLTITASFLLFGAPITKLNLVGYAITLAAVAWYQHSKCRAMQEGEPGERS